MGVFPMRCPLFEAAGNGPCDSEAMINLMGPYCIGLSTDSRGLKGFHFLVLMVQGSSDQQSHCFFVLDIRSAKRKIVMVRLHQSVKGIQLIPLQSEHLILGKGECSF